MIGVRVRWPVTDPGARLSELEPVALAEWAGHLAGLGVWGSTRPRFRVCEVDPGEAWDVDEDEVHGVLEARAEVLLGPLALRSVVS